MFLDKYRSVEKKKDEKPDEKDKVARVGKQKINRKNNTGNGAETREKKPGGADRPDATQKNGTAHKSKPDGRLINVSLINELIRRCAFNNATRRDWLELQKQYAFLVNNRVEVTLVKIGIPRENITDEIADEIDGRISEKLCDGKSFKTIAGYENPTAGFGMMVENVVRSWAREQRLLKNAYGTYVKKGFTSIYTPLGEDDDDGTLIETIPDTVTNPFRSPQEEAIHENVIKAMRDIDSIPDTKKRLAFKLTTMFYKPLSDDDIKEIAELGGASTTEIENALDAIMARLAEENEEIEKNLAHMDNTFTDLQSKKAKLADKLKDFNTPESELAYLEADIAGKTELQENLIRRNQKINVFPTVEEIAQLLNIRKEKKKGISVGLSRFRKSSKKTKRRNKPKKRAS